MNNQKICISLDTIIRQLTKAKFKACNNELPNNVFFDGKHIKIYMGEVEIYFNGDKTTVYMDANSPNIAVDNDRVIPEKQVIPRMMGRPNSLNGSRTCPRCHGQGKI